MPLVPSSAFQRSTRSASAIVSASACRISPGQLAGAADGLLRVVDEVALQVAPAPLELGRPARREQAVGGRGRRRGWAASAGGGRPGRPRATSPALSAAGGATGSSVDGVGRLVGDRLLGRQRRAGCGSRLVGAGLGRRAEPPGRAAAELPARSLPARSLPGGRRRSRTDGRTCRSGCRRGLDAGGGSEPARSAGGPEPSASGRRGRGPAGASGRAPAGAGSSVDRRHGASAGRRRAAASPGAGLPPAPAAHRSRGGWRSSSSAGRRRRPAVARHQRAAPGDRIRVGRVLFGGPGGAALPPVRPAGATLEELHGEHRSRSRGRVPTRSARLTRP